MCGDIPLQNQNQNRGVVSLYAPKFVPSMKLLMVFRSLQAILGFLWIVAVAFELFDAVMFWDEYAVQYCYMLTAVLALDMINATLSASVLLISDLTLICTLSHCI